MYAHLTPFEIPIITQFGTTVLTIFKRTLKTWASTMLTALAKTHHNAKVDMKVHVDIIMDHLRNFQRQWERVFGLMESGAGSEGSGNEVRILSTGYGVKVLLGLVMADRLSVLDRLRKIERKKIGRGLAHPPLFVELPPDEIPEDRKICPICQDGIGDGNHVDTTGIQLTVCCGQVVGDGCLRYWLRREEGRESKRSCPCCRFLFSKGFLDRLLMGYESKSKVDPRDEDGEGGGHVVINLLSPTATPEPEIEFSHDDILPDDLDLGLDSEGDLELSGLDADSGNDDGTWNALDEEIMDFATHLVSIP
jgi:hypothetical protein